MGVRLARGKDGVSDHTRKWEVTAQGKCCLWALEQGWGKRVWAGNEAGDRPWRSLTASVSGLDLME